MKPIIIIGSGLAGYSLARELRKLDTTTPLLIITQDKGEAYSKPMLSAAYSQGKTAEGLVSASIDEMAQSLNATILADTIVDSIDPSTKTISSSQGRFEYKALVLALGADVIRLKLTGNGVDDVLSVNDLWDYSKFREKLGTAKSVAILGSGLIGCEFANDLAGKGHDITVIGMTQQPLSPLIPAKAGEALKNKLSSLGIHWQLGRTAQAIERTDSGLSILLDNGEKICADIVLSAIGLRARTTLAAAAGITVNRGIVVDDFLQTSVADVYALGDCMEINGQVMPYVMPIMHASRTLAKTLAGERTAVTFPAMPVSVKTTAYPITVLSPPLGTEGTWELLENNDGLKFGFMDGTKKLQGFVLTEAKTKQRMAMLNLLGA